MHSRWFPTYFRSINYFITFASYFRNVITVSTKKNLRNLLNLLGNKDKSIGFVPTMGALHAGHISLVRAAKEENDIVVASIFVNPTQFNDAADLERYPRNFEKDQTILEVSNCDILFAPDVSEMYPQAEDWSHDFKHLDSILEGKFRPGHFNGVGQIVKKLLSLVKPDKAYFGQKDYQQFLIVKQLVKDFRMKVKLVCCPIIREEDGLAMSSRNIRLSPGDRKKAAHISRVLLAVKEKAKSQTDTYLLKEFAIRKLREIDNFEVEYFEIAKVNDLSPLSHLSEETRAIALTAVKVGGIRLIDNMMLS